MRGTAYGGAARAVLLAKLCTPGFWLKDLPLALWREARAQARQSRPYARWCSLCGQLRRWR